MPPPPIASRRLILHVDMDAFFASIEQARRPELAGKPLVVGGHGDPRERAVVASASYEARRFGIRSAMPLRQVLRLCPQAIFVPMDHDRYESVSATIKALLKQVSPILEDAGIDEAFLDISDLADPEAVGREIKRRIKDATGLTCSIGIGPNKLLAKLASDMQKPDGLTLITLQEVQDRIWPLPADRLPGVGPKTMQRLRRMDVVTVGDLAAKPLHALEAEFGHCHGLYLHEAAWGLD